MPQHEGIQRMDSELPRSPKFLEARDSLPEQLRPIYDEMVTDYVWYTTKSFGRGYVAYAVLAELVRAGWRPTERQGSTKQQPSAEV
jgi:hypothetical protein